MTLPNIEIHYPSWLRDSFDWDQQYPSDDDKMRLAIELSRMNVMHGTGGPFGAAIFERGSGRLVAVGMNLVIPNNNSALHGEIVAFMMAQARLATHTLNTLGGPGHELATSCEPCAMCLGATLWSGVSRMLCGASREDAQRLQFDEGPVFPESYAYLEARGIEIVHEVCREEAAEVLELYQSLSGVIYNR